MMTLQIVFTILAGAILALWLGVASRRPRKIAVANVVAELVYVRSLRVMSLCFALTPPTLLLCLIWRLNWRDEQMLILAGSLFLCLALPPGLLLVEVARTQVILSEEGLTRVSPWRATAVLAWTEIDRVRYSALNRWYELHAGGRTVRISCLLDGIAKFVDLARTKIPAERRGDLV